MSDDDDYMSEKFIQNVETYNRPSLIFKNSDKRAIALSKKKAEDDEKRKANNKLYLEQEKRDEGLSSALSTDNKGFEMLMKMGYKPGQGIGKNESGRSEPIPMNIRTSRLGLGKICKKQCTKKVNPTDKLRNMRTNEFRDRIALQKLAQLMDHDLVKSQKVCEELDSKNNVNEPVESWYWPNITVMEDSSDDSSSESKEKNKNGNDDNEEDENEEKRKKTNQREDGDVEIEIPTETKLEIITGYLRKQYAYCIWCGVSYNDQNDLNENCPGNTRSDH